MFQKICLFLLLLATLSTATLSAQKSFPLAQVIDLDRQPVALADYVGNGKLSVIAVWATWCQPCHIELDHLKGHLTKWEEEYEVNVLAISIDQRHQFNRIKPLVRRKGWKYNVLVDQQGALQRDLGFQSIPRIYIVDGEGQIVKDYRGYEKGREEQIDQLLRRLRAK